ncbi:MAG: glycosyltransferase family 4 protein [Planctomycetaceae bacterium]|nr:glycosyltransferase family 4 protein [Planctomycetaceae bacterium]
MDSNNDYVLCLNATRVVNKRMAMFFECLCAKGTSVRVLALPRHRWSLDRGEQPFEITQMTEVRADIGQVTGRRLSAILCFHWAVLPFAVLFGLMLRVPVTYDEHDHYELNTLEGSGGAFKLKLSSLLVRWIHRLFLPWVRLVTCIHLKDGLLKNHLQQWQSEVIEIHNYPARIWRESAQPAENSGRLCFVYIGGVFAEKGVGAAAKAFQLLPATIQQKAELHIFGDGDKALIEWLRSQPGIVVHNAVAPAVFREFAASHRCVGLSMLAATPRYSLVGTNCTKLYEYLALGMPVIATRVGEFESFVTTNQIGLLIDGHMDPVELSKAMTQLVSDPSLCAHFSQQASDLMRRDEMTWENEWQKIETSGHLAKSRAA